MLWTIFNAGFWSPEVDLRVVYNSVNILARVKSGDTLSLETCFSSLQHNLSFKMCKCELFIVAFNLQPSL